MGFDLRPLTFAALLFAAPAFAEPAAQLPRTAAPAATASFQTRQVWCEQYASWVIAQTPTQGPIPSDVRPTHRFEVEFNSCKPDPRRYQRQTRAEIEHAARVRNTGG